MHKDNCVIVENIIEVIRTESKNQEVLRQKLIALPFPQKIRWKIRIFHTHGKCYLAKEHPWFSCLRKCPMHGVTRRITNAAKLITLKQEVPDNSWTCAMWYTPMIFHSNPSSNILKTTLVAGCFSSRKKRQTQPQVKDCVQSLFFPSGKDKSWCNGPAGATWHSNGTSMEIPGAQAACLHCHRAGSRHIQLQHSISAIPALTPKLKTKLEISSDLPKF